MSAVLKKMEPKREKRGGFLVPTVEEIEAHMKEKMKWPDGFCKWYADKFWNNYEASGWKLSNGNPMKSWPAAFASNWQDLKYEESREKLKSYQKLKPVEKQNGNYLNDLLNQYKQQFDSVTPEALIAAYDFLKAEKRLKLTQAEKDLIVKVYSNDPAKGKAACVTTLFMRMINHGQTF